MSSLELLGQVALILVAAKFAGIASQRFGLPAVFGKLLVGVLLGPSLLGFIHNGPALRTIADIGVLLLMFIAGLETDVEQMRRVGAASFLAAVGGVILPFVGGVALSLAFGLSVPTALFIGAILTATSVSISAQTLRELGRLQSREGTAILGAAVIDDVLGVLVLAVVTGMAKGDSSFWPAIKMAIFLPVACLAGTRLLLPVVNWLSRHLTPDTILALVIAAVLAYSWAAESLGSMAAITGAYVAGLLLARAPVMRVLDRSVSTIGYAFFIPIFFVSVGMQAELSGLIATPLLAGLLIVVAVLSKAVGCWAGALLGRFTLGESLRVGVGMISRGEVALVVAAAGLQAGLINNAEFSVAIVMTLFTTLVTPLLLRLTYLRMAKAPAAELTPAVARPVTQLASGTE